MMATVLARGRLDGHGAQGREGPVRRRAVVGRRRRLGVAHRVRPRRHALHDRRLGRRRERRPGSGHEHPQGQDPAAARRRHGAAGQPVRRARRSSSRRSTRWGHRNSLGAHRPPGDRRAVEQRERAERRRRDQHHQGREELRLADGQHGPLVRRTVAGQVREGRHGRAAGVLDAGDRGVRADGLHRRQVPGVAQQRVRRRDALRRDPEHRPPAAHRLQREDAKRSGARCC